MTNLGEIYDSM